MELGQSNAAWLLERGFAHAGPRAAAVAAALFRRSAEQGNVASLLQLGDAYYHGRGVPRDWVRAAAIYYEAYRERSAEAMFNLGYMHQYGAGVPADLALARRLYNMAAHTNADAALPVALANAWLRVHSAWEMLRRVVPAPVVALVSPVFELRHPHSSSKVGSENDSGSSSGSGTWLAQLTPSALAWQLDGLLRRTAQATGLSAVSPTVLLEQYAEFGETALLLLLLAVLLVVLRIRRQRQQALEARVLAALAAPGGEQQQLAAQIAAQMGLTVPPAVAPPTRTEEASPAIDPQQVQVPESASARQEQQQEQQQQQQQQQQSAAEIVAVPADCSAAAITDAAASAEQQGGAAASSDATSVAAAESSGLRCNGNADSSASEAAEGSCVTTSNCSDGIGRSGGLPSAPAAAERPSGSHDSS
jgi:SEL1 protein